MKHFSVSTGLIISVFLFSCDRTNNDPGYDYFPDMYYSLAYETNSENPNFTDGTTMRVAVEGTIPRGMVPYPFTKNDADRLMAGILLENPFRASEENIARGGREFRIFCLHCHGELGDGEGNLYKSGLYTLKPASLINGKMRSAPDGETYHVITVGQGVMMAHGSQIKPEDRWKIVLYVRKLQHMIEDSGF
jgi:mono/diheme cytochrome c family protein